MRVETRQEYLVRFLRGCSVAADAGELGIHQGRLLVNGDLMREAADELEALLPQEEKFKSFSDELLFNLVRAEQHTSQAHDMLYKGGPPRSFLFKRAVGRAHSMLTRATKKELERKE